MIEEKKLQMECYVNATTVVFIGLKTETAK